jgi:hypothetical protein
MRLRMLRSLSVDGQLRREGDEIEVSNARLCEKLLSWNDAIPANLSDQRELERLTGRRRRNFVLDWGRFGER